MYTKLHETVPHGVYAPSEDLVHEGRLCGHRMRILSRCGPAFMHHPDFRQTVKFRGGEFHMGGKRGQWGRFRGLG